MCEPGSEVYVSGGRVRFGRGEVVRTRRDGKLLIRFAWDGTEHAVKAEHVRPLEHTVPVPLPMLASVPDYGGELAPSPKPEPPARMPVYLAWLRRQPCIVCGTRYAIEASHHPAKMQGTRGRKCSDLRAISLCHYHHARHHSRPLDRELVEDAIEEHVCRWVREVGDEPQRR